MKKILFVIPFFLLSSWLWAQDEKTIANSRSYDSAFNSVKSRTAIFLTYENRWVPLEKIGKCVIYTKDHLKIKKATLVELKPKYITFMYDGNLHDIMKDEISRIETSMEVPLMYSTTSYYFILFDDLNRPYFYKKE
jgi:hypothetical protein